VAGVTPESRGDDGRAADRAEAAGRLAARRAATLRRLERLDREFAGIVEASASGATDDEHDPEGATIAFERQHVAALAGRARQELADIDAAMRRLAQGSYGTCEGCGRPIAAARLAARPVTTRCIGCASRR
jgi:RNA polymerase-binding protein DksA